MTKHVLSMSKAPISIAGRHVRKAERMGRGLSKERKEGRKEESRRKNKKRGRQRGEVLVGLNNQQWL